jgi:hypothetical protein
MIEAVLREDEREAVKELEARSDDMDPELLPFYIAMTPAQLVEHLGPFVDRGVGDFVLVARPPVDHQTLELFAREVAGALRA